MITINDIQIFVATHNRADLLKETLESLLSQTAGVTQITVLDNDSTDHTCQVVSSFATRGVQYVSTTGFLGNFYKARELVQKPYCMIFHDDDLLHPHYLQTVLSLLNQFPQTSLVTSAYTPFIHGQSASFDTTLLSKHLFFDTPRKWACYMYFVEGVSYAPAVYRTDAFLQNDLEYEKFNKFNDWPFMLKMSQYGPVIYLTDKHCIHVRVHPGQDSSNAANYPNIKQMVNWDACFFRLMGSPTYRDILYWIYAIRNKHFLLGKYKSAPPAFRKEHPVQELKQEVARQELPLWGWGCLGRLTKHILLALHIMGPKSKLW